MSTPHCSFVTYLNQDWKQLPSFLQDLRSFFQKFPLNYEIIVVVEKNSSASLEEFASFPVIFVQNSHFLGRAESLRQGLNAAQGTYLLTADLHMSTPLGDLFKILQNLMSDESLDICWGERYSRKDSPFLNLQTVRLRNEIFFNPILKEKNRNASQDPLCDIGGIKKISWSKMQEALPKKISAWYLHPVLIPATRHLKILEIPVYDSGATPPGYSVLKVRWSLLKQSIF